MLMPSATLLANFAPQPPCPLAGDMCPACKGKCLVSEKKTFEVHIEQGMKQGSRIVLRGEAGCSEPGLAPGDVVLVVQQREHETFKRVNVDLVIEKKISLTEALCGATLHIKHLDGRILKVSTPIGEHVRGFRVEASTRSPCP
jgi:DnaJ family protein A protein 2